MKSLWSEILEFGSVSPLDALRDENSSFSIDSYEEYETPAYEILRGP
jgi:hypothetical protein